MAVVKNEKYFQNKFLEHVLSDNPGFFENSFANKEIPLPYDTTKKVKSADNFMPDSRSDLIELDGDNNFHLWEVKLIHSGELKAGQALGQIIFYDFLFSTFTEEEIKEILIIKKGFPEDRISQMTGEDFHFKTWNILVGGGEGWELSAGVNPVMWNYFTLAEKYLKSDIPILNTFHFYEVEEGFDLKHLSELSIFYPRRLHPEAFSKFLENEGCSEGYWNNSLLTMHCQKSGMTDAEQELIEKYIAGYDKENPTNIEAFCERSKISLDRFDKLYGIYESACNKMSFNEEEENNFKKMLNTKIGRDWFEIH
jgi:hypothetical protein